LLYDRSAVEPGTLGVVQAVVANQGSGWTFTLDDLRRYYERVSARVARADADALAARREAAMAGTAVDPPPFFAALEGWYLGAAATLGRRTAELHLALAAIPGDAFEPEPLAGSALDELASALVMTGERHLDLLAARRDTLPDVARPHAEAVLASRATILERLAGIRALREAGRRTRVHGDYHLGQVLRTDADFVIIDFEGEPARSLAERRAKHSPLKDVAGMLRSFDYAAHAALIGFAQSSPGAADALSPWAEGWHRWVSRAFLAAYREAMGRSSLLPDGSAFDALLSALVLEKALYEVGYELNSRPDWARIPLAALVHLLQG
jgi:trehalose synthase-fused probable maltokinase